MKMSTMFLSAGLAACAVSSAGAKDGLSKEERALDRASAELDQDAVRPEGPKTVESKLKLEYFVDDARIQGLRDQKLGYGEISIALALAEKRPGGITDANVQAVMAERLGPPKVGWGKIAKNQGTSLGKVDDRMRRVGAAVRKQDKAERALERRTDKAAGGAKAETPSRVEKVERSERAGNPGKSKR